MLDKEKREILPTSITKSYVVRRLPTLVSLALVGVGWLLNEVALAWIHERVPRDTPPLPDLWFSWFPEEPLVSLYTLDNIIQDAFDWLGMKTLQRNKYAVISLEKKRDCIAKR
ncbi:hypothetical protein ANCDUO_24613 [Ancylostoma duodenale]|uniref:Uncharacterized protein n=1 Tax=Ancylostoma duodenale TaxID=51022 RepID=A0A0C2FKJ0_9BILA|nr:hypothetical protein ANCDUO_24613 [Ancylostoma duodenale]